MNATVLIQEVMQGIQSAIFVIAFFVAYRLTSLVGFRLIYLASSAHLALYLLSLFAMVIPASSITPAAVHLYAVGRALLVVSLWAVGIVGGLLVLRSHLYRTQNRVPDTQHA
ncbi:MAG: hypothetical protein KDA78_17680 [Planctomycetaceae bacterium]|nr:hypothetical protein [Planctomycetaceae bacterium]